MEFELRRGKVDDLTDREEHDLIFNQLTDYWKLQVAKEEKAMQRRQFWVRITNVEEGSTKGSSEWSSKSWLGKR